MITPTAAERSSLVTLKTVLGDRSRDTLYLCILDLVENGLDLARFAPAESVPNRQDITQYLAAWSRHAGMSEEESRNWLIDYCSTTLAVISKRTPAAIRHSTKSNLKYIYNSAVPFLCGCEGNKFHARCAIECPVHADMKEKGLAKAIEDLKPRPMASRPAPLEPYIPIKKLHQEQFNTGMSLALDEHRKGVRCQRIVDLLNERGLKTRTGKKWGYTTLRNELMKLNNSQLAPQSGAEGA